MTFEEFWTKVRRRLLKMRLQPIGVFCFHQVGEVFEPDTMSECDWTQTEQFKRSILALKKKYTFVSLQEAHRRLSTDNQSRSTEKFLTTEEVKTIVEQFAPFVTIASHGWRHADSMKMSRQEFEENVTKSEAFLKDMPGKVPFYASAYGRRIQYQTEWLLEHSLIPVFANDWKNYNNSNCIHRELLDGKCID